MAGSKPEDEDEAGHPPPTGQPPTGQLPDGQAEQSRPPRRTKPLLRRPAVLIGLLVAAAAGAAGGVLYWLHAREYEDTDDAFVDGEIVQVSPKVPGLIQSVEVGDNQDVPAGAVLLRIDPRDLKAKLDEAKAAVEAARARVESARTNADLVSANTEAMLAEARAGVEQARAAVQSSKDQVASAEADVTAAAADATRRQADLKRYKSLDPRAVSQQQLDAAQAAADSADANLAAARKRAAAAQSAVTEAQGKEAYANGVLAAAQTGPQQIAVAAAQVTNAQATLQEALAAHAEAELNLSYATITAPVAGRVTRRTARPGQYLQVGQIVLALVQPGVWVTANFKENQIAHMTHGQDVEIDVDAYPGCKFHGKVDSIQAGSGARFSLLPPENATGNYVKVVQRVPVKIVFDSDDWRNWLLAPGMSVVPRVHVGVGGEQRPLPIEAGPARQATTQPGKLAPTH